MKLTTSRSVLCRVHILGVCWVAAAAGCAVVDPRADYERALGHVEAATGYSVPWRPDDQGFVERYVRDLLADGIDADEAVQIALLNNPRIRAGFLDIGIARADLVQSGLLSNPSLSLGLRFPDGGGLANLEAGIAQNLADLWQIPARTRVSQRALDETILRVAFNTAMAATDARTAYFKALQADRKHRITKESVEIARQVVDLALARQQAGAGGEIDVNLARSELLEAELALRSAALESFEARSELAVQLGLTASPDTLDLVDDLPEPPEWTVTDDTLLTLARANRLDIRAAAGAADAAAARVREERLKVFPTLELGVGMERSERSRAQGRNILADSALASLGAGQPTVDIAPKEKQGTDVIIGPTLGMELPVFNRNQGGIARAELEHRQSLMQLDGLNRQVAQEIRRAHARARVAWDNVRFYRDQVLPLRETSLELGRTAYQAGRTSLLNVLAAQRALLTARAGYADSLQASAAALVELEKATGQPLNRILEATAATRPAPAQIDEAAASQPAARDEDRD